MRKLLFLGIILIALSSAALGALNVKTQFGAKGDAQKITDGQFSNVTATSAILNSATATFKSSDVGKMVWCVYRPTGGLAIPITTITGFISPNSVTLANLNGTNTAMYPGLNCVWGTDDTAALRSAAAAAMTTSRTGESVGPFSKPAQVIFVPAGGYIASGYTFSFQGTTGNELGVSLVGEGAFSTMFFLRPDATGSLLSAFGPGGTYKDFGVDADGYVFPWPAWVHLLRFSCSPCTVENINITQWGAGSSSAALAFLQGTAYVSKLRIQGSSATAAYDDATAIYIDGT